MTRKMASQTKSEFPIIQPGKTKSKSSLPRSGRGRIRACVLIFVHLVILAHIAHYWRAGRSISPVEPSEAMYAIELGQVNAGAIFFGLAILSTAIFGRFFCGWGCHLVALQDLSGYLMRRIGFRPKPLRSRLLVFVPFALAFYMFFWPTLQRLWQGHPHPGFSNHLMTENFWQTFPGPFVSLLTFIVCGGLIVYLLGNKGFCTYACPYGAFFLVSDRLALGRIRVTDACQHCGQCTAHCTSNVQVHAEVRDFGMVVDPGCMKCMDCVSVCPNDALYYGLTQKTALNDSSSTLPILSEPPRSKKTYDFSLPEELFGLIVAGITIYAVRGLYDITPLLLSVAVGVITAFLAIQFFRSFHKRDQRVQNLQLKRERQFTRVGRLAIVFFCVWLAFIAHSFFVQYHRFQGRHYLNRITATWEELLNGTVQHRLTEQDRANIDRALRSYRFTDQIGLINVLEVKRGLAFGNIMIGNLDDGEKYLRRAYRLDPPKVREMLWEFLMTQDRQEEAAKIR
jgi:polyferredoxin